jgi:hypothetical protein
MTHYAGIGSRETPNVVIAQMKLAAAMLAMRGFTLRSGHAPVPIFNRMPDTDSADLAFEAGCDSVNGAKEIRCTSLHPPALLHAARFHPNWNACNEHVRSLHARNSLVMFGDDLATPVKFALCYTREGRITGGTGQALRIAAASDIPVFNYATSPADSLWRWIDERTS